MNKYMESYLVHVAKSVYVRSGLFPLYVVFFRTLFNEIRQAVVLSDSQLKQVIDSLKTKRCAYHTLALRGTLLLSMNDIENATLGVYAYRLYVNKYRRIFPLHHEPESDKILQALENGRKKLIEKLREDLELSKPFNDLDSNGLYLTLMKSIALVELLDRPCRHIDQAKKILFGLRNYVEHDQEVPRKLFDNALKLLIAVVDQCLETPSQVFSTI